MALRPNPVYGEGDYLPQVGATFGATISINGRSNIPQPSDVKYIPPAIVGRTTRGKPIYQGMPKLELRWNAMDIDGFQALSVEFFTQLNSEDGPIVDVVWPSPYEAGRFLAAKAYLEWPFWDGWSEAFLNGVQVTLSCFSLPGQGIFINPGLRL